MIYQHDAVKAVKREVINVKQHYTTADSGTVGACIAGLFHPNETPSA
jgi:hypothetical protein